MHVFVNQRVRTRFEIPTRSVFLTDCLYSTYSPFTREYVRGQMSVKVPKEAIIRDDLSGPHFLIKKH